MDKADKTLDDTKQGIKTELQNANSKLDGIKTGLNDITSKFNNNFDLLRKEAENVNKNLLGLKDAFNNKSNTPSAG